MYEQMQSILNAFRDNLLTADADATHYFGRGDGDYTVWTEYELDGMHAGDVLAEPLWRVLVERFTTDENDAITQAIFKMMLESEYTFQYSLRRGTDGERLYHTWDCEVT